MKTAIEWLMSQMLAASINKETEEMHITLPKDVFKQAKAMEKEQIIESYCIGCADITKDNNIFPRETSEQYYNETFKSE